MSRAETSHAECRWTEDAEESPRALGRALQEAQLRNQRLATALELAREQLLALREEVETLTAAPNGYGVFLHDNGDGTLELLVEGRALRVNAGAELDPTSLRHGQRVLLNECSNAIAPADFGSCGEVATVVDRLDDDRALVLGGGDTERVVTIAAPLRETPLKAGDPILVDPRAAIALEKLPRSAVEEVALEEVPDVGYDQVGGLADQLETLRDAIELPYLHPEIFREHQLSPPKGILLYGPPGCGKTLMAKAVANSLAREIEQRTGTATTAYFLNVKGPELLNKYVGETEHKIREVFRKARDKSSDDVPVVIFFDEMDSLFRMRGSGISSDMEATVVAQFLAEIDGVESLQNVVVIGATNRPDLIDPAVLRPGRLDLKVKVERPDADGAREIFSKYLTADLPLHPEACAQGRAPAR
jgi:proteasome-associated ATPase